MFFAPQLVCIICLFALMLLLVVIADLLQKSLKVLTSSNILLHKLAQLQNIEALQRKGAVLQDVETQEQVKVSSFFLQEWFPPSPPCLSLHVLFSQCFQCSRGIVFRLEELVEMLQDRRRRADQAAMLLIQQQQESKETESQVRSSQKEVFK